MNIEHTKHTKAGIFTGLMNRIVNLVLPFVTRTVLLYVLGTEYLGLSGLFSSLLSFLALAELGVSNALIYSMYRPIAENDKVTLRGLLALYRKLYRIIGTVILAGGLACLPFLRYFIRGDVPPDVNIYVLYGAYLANTVCSYFLFAYRGSLLIAHQRVDVDNLVNTLIPLLIWCAQMLALLLTRSYYACAVFLPISTIVTNFVRLYQAKKLYPDLYPEGNVPPELERGIYQKMKALLGAKISSTVLHSSDNIVISAFLGLTMVTVYGNYHYIMSAVGAFLGILYAALLPGIGNSLVTEAEEKNYRDFKTFTFANLWLVGWCAVCLLCLYQPFIRLWAGEQLLLPDSGMLLMVLYFVLYQSRKVVITYKDAAGLWWEDRHRPLVMAASNLILSLILVQFLGIRGVILATVLSLCISIPWETYTVFRYVFRRSPGEYGRTLLKFAVVLVITSVVTLGICHGIPGLLLRGVICLVVPNLIFFLAYRRQEEFVLALKFLKR